MSASITRASMRVRVAQVLVVSMLIVRVLRHHGGSGISGNIDSDTEQENFLFKGIANRAFTRAFALTDEVVVNDAEIINGMLKIGLERLIPDHKKLAK